MISALVNEASQGLSSGLVMRPMQTSDLDAVLSIEYRIYPYPWARGHFADSLTSGYACWVGRSVAAQHALVAYFVLMLAVDDAHLLTIGVAENHQGQGFGARMLQQAMLVARQANAKNLLLEVRPSNEKALALYRQFGFRQIGLRRAYYPAPDGREDACVLLRSLDEVLV